MTIYYHKIHGLVIASEIELPELTVVPPQRADVTIREGEVPVHLSGVQADDIGCLMDGISYEMKGHDFLICFPGQVVLKL